jgi:hypothetical protein
MNAKNRLARFFLIAVAGISLVTGLWSGLVRIGWPLPQPSEQFVIVHGPLMVVGFLGTLIGLERAVALGVVWPYGIPILTGLSALFALIGLAVPWSGLLAAVAALLLIGVFVALYRQYPTEHFIIMALSALSWLAGNLLWCAEKPIFAVVPWWVGFLVLMIAGERLELSRIRRPPARVRVLFHAAVALILSGLIYSLMDFGWGVRIAGAGLLILALWLLRYDLVWFNLRQGPLPCYMAQCLIAGYLWLILGGIFWLGFAKFFSAGQSYDAMLHGIFLGFVFSMIFAHAPIILPTITDLSLPFQRIFYLHAGLLHVSLLLRVTGDLGLWPSLQQWGGLLNVLAVLLFLVNSVRAVKLGLRPHREPV